MLNFVAIRKGINTFPGISAPMKEVSSDKFATILMPETVQDIATMANIWKSMLILCIAFPNWICTNVADFNSIIIIV